MVLDELLKDETSSQINEPEFSQPLYTALQVALVQLLKSWGVHADAVVGHSSGEVAAAFAIGALTRESAWEIAFYRGSLSGILAKSELNSGAMLSVALSPEAVTEYFDSPDVLQAPRSISIACFNSPKNVTLSGSRQKVDAVQKLLDTEGIFARTLKVSNACYLRYIEDITEEYLRLIGDISPPKPPVSTTRFYSSVTGRLVQPVDLTKAGY